MGLLCMPNYRTVCYTEQQITRCIIYNFIGASHPACCLIGQKLQVLANQQTDAVFSNWGCFSRDSRINATTPFYKHYLNQTFNLHDYVNSLYFIKRV